MVHPVHQPFDHVMLELPRRCIGGRFKAIRTGVSLDHSATPDGVEMAAVFYLRESPFGLFPGLLL